MVAILHAIKEGWLTGLVTSRLGATFYTRSWRKGRRKTRSDGKTRKKNWAVTGWP